MSYIPGDFSFIKNENERYMLSDAYQAVSTTESWDIVAQDPEGGFMFSKNEKLNPINNAIKYTGHSGASYGWTIRVMQQIGKYGCEAFVETNTALC